jgi:hypothetical protein
LAAGKKKKYTVLLRATWQGRLTGWYCWNLIPSGCFHASTAGAGI